MTTRYLEVWSQKICFKKNVFRFLRLPLFVLPFLVNFLEGKFLILVALGFFWYANLFSKATEDVIKNHPENKIHVHSFIPSPFATAFLPFETLVPNLYVDRINLLGEPRIFRGRKRRPDPNGRAEGRSSDGFAKSPRGWNPTQLCADYFINRLTQGSLWKYQYFMESSSFDMFSLHHNYPPWN